MPPCSILVISQVCSGCSSWALMEYASTMVLFLLMIWIPSVWVRLSPQCLGYICSALYCSSTSMLFCLKEMGGSFLL
jgi:hypothetical protein